MTLLLSVFSVNVYADNNPSVKSVISKVEIANFEILNMDKLFFSQILFKQNNCETDGYSFFSPYNLDKNLMNDTFSSEYTNGEISVTIHRNEEDVNFTISDIIISEEGTLAELNIAKENSIYISKIHGTDLTVDGIIASFSNNENQSLIQVEPCTLCVLAAIIVIADSVDPICKNGQEDSSTCNGILTVEECNCSCE